MNLQVTRLLSGVTLASAIVASGCVSINGPLAIGDEVGTSKIGKSCIQHTLFNTEGDASIHAAKKNGGITRVATVDTTFDTTLFIHSEFCTVVRGE